MSPSEHAGLHPQPRLRPQTAWPANAFSRSSTTRNLVILNGAQPSEACLSEADGILGCSGAGSFALLSPPSASCLFPGKLIQFGCEKVGSDLLAIDPTLQERVLAPVRRWASHSSHQESRDMAYARGSLAAGGTALCFQAEGGSVYRLLP